MESYRDKHGNILYGQEAREARQLEENTKAYMDAAGAVHDWVNSWSPQALISFFCVGVVGFFTILLITAALRRYGVNVKLPLIGCGIIAAVAAFVCKFLFQLFQKIMIPVIGLVFIVLAGTGLSLSITGNGSLTKTFNTLNAKMNGQSITPRAAPQANAGELETYRSGDKTGAKIMGVYGDWLLANIGPQWGWIGAEEVAIQNGKKTRPLQAVQVISNTLNIRDFPRMTAARDENKAEKGDAVYVMGKEKRGWVPVCFVKDGNLSKGYALASSLAIEGAGAKTLTPPQGTPTVADKNRTMQSGRYIAANFTAKRIKAGETYILLDPKPTKSGWYHVWFDGEEGWI
jgi:hypothetical protein